ncbi:MAG: sorbosone dehydrogenase family protein [Mucilaginibacter sp.]|nr:sorbosone dehydrogenase family protein [Mucilaginibacter sp.]
MKTKLILTLFAGMALTTNAQQHRPPPPNATKSTTQYCKVIGWQRGQKPTAPPGFKVTMFANRLDNPRNMYVAQNGDVFVSEANTELKWLKKLGSDIVGASKSQNLGKSANRITLLRDKNGDGLPDMSTVFLSGLNQPFGMLILGNWFYVANTDGLWRFAYKPGQLHITGPGKLILRLPASGYNNHWTRNLRANAAGTKIYIAVGSGTNVMEKGPANEARRAGILEINPDGTGERIYASGLRNPAGIDFEPRTRMLWAAVNERDELGDELVPDYLTSVRPGGFYGWPYSYFGQHIDSRVKPQRPDLVRKAIVPDFDLGAHTASLGLAFYTGSSFPRKYMGGAFIGQHGSWNKSTLAGYKVTFVPFTNGRPAGPMQDFLTGFIANPSTYEVHGRPVGIAIAKDGSLLVADDAANTIWRVSTH